MRELTKLEIEQLDFSGRVPDLIVDDYQLIGLAAETPSIQKRNRPVTNRADEKRRLARSA